MRVRTTLSLALLGSLAACAKASEVELRLAPCGEPLRVDVDVQGYDADGAALAPLRASFTIADSGVFSDGYATVGLAKPAGMVTADFTLTWYAADDAASVVVLPGLAVPAAGEVLELGASDCTPVDGETTTSGNTDASTSTGSGTSTGSETSTDATTTDASTTSTTDASTTTTGAESTGDDTTTSTETTGSTGDDTTTGEPGLEGTPCDPVEVQFACDHGGPGQVGDLLKCDMMMEKWVLVDPTQCMVDVFCADIGITNPVSIGCSGTGQQFSCLCQETPPVDCDMTETPCSGPDTSVLTLCVDTGMGPKRTQAHCAVCDETDPTKPFCSG